MHDAAGRLTGIDRPNGVNRINQYTAADELDRYYERRSSDSILLAYGRFRYDAAGRPTSRYRLPQPQEWVEPAFDAVYDADNRISQWDAQAVTHDNDGNMTFGPLPGSGLTNYVFDARNRLTAVGGVNYSYDASNNRIGMTTPNGTTWYVIDPHGDALPRVLVRKQPDESLTYYVYGIGLLYETDESDTATYYHFDHIGSTVALTDEAGEITDRIEYSAYGSVTHREGTTDTPFLYVGQLGIQQDDNGLLYMRARYYSPEARRFVNADPIGFDGGMNWYSYANNSPLRYVDPTGMYLQINPDDGNLSRWAKTTSFLLFEGTGQELERGAAAAVDGFIPLATPFEHIYSNPDGSIDTAYQVSRVLGSVSRTASMGAVSAAAVNTIISTSGGTATLADKALLSQVWVSSLISASAPPVVSTTANISLFIGQTASTIETGYQVYNLAISGRSRQVSSSPSTTRGIFSYSAPNGQLSPNNTRLEK